MESSHVEPCCCGFANQAAYSLLHFSGSLVGKRQGQDIPRIHSLFEQICYLVGKHTGLARPCAGYD